VVAVGVAVAVVMKAEGKAVQNQFV
jgi:hypothetical protein